MHQVNRQESVRNYGARIKRIVPAFQLYLHHFCLNNKYHLPLRA